MFFRADWGDYNPYAVRSSRRKFNVPDYNQTDRQFHGKYWDLNKNGVVSDKEYFGSYQQVGISLKKERMPFISLERGMNQAPHWRPGTSAWNRVHPMEDPNRPGQGRLKAAKRVHEHVSAITNTETPIIQLSAGSLHTSDLDSMSSGAPSQPAVTKGHSHTFLDSGLIVANGAQLKSIKMKLGKAVYPDLITPFLKHIQGKGNVSVQWTGRIIAPVGERHYHNEIFRHCLSKSTDGTIDTLPSDMTEADVILTPVPDSDFTPISGQGVITYPDAPTRGVWRDIQTGTDFWTPLTRPDLEDMSWNLNKLKLGPVNSYWDNEGQVISSTDNLSIRFPAGAYPAGSIVSVTGGPVVGLSVGTPNAVPVYKADTHSRMSAIYLNNETNINTALPSNDTDNVVAYPAGYSYNAVLNHGSVSYSFMNKGEGPAKIELIVYRIKRGKQPPATWEQYGDTGTADDNNNYFCRQQEEHIGQGFIARSVGNSLGTENFGGRLASKTDVSSNPNFPLFPKIKQTVQSNLDLAEVQRISFAMPSGNRRAVDIVLPGDVYDPASIPKKTNAVSVTGGVSSTDVAPILDEHSYVICMGVSGALAGNLLTSNSGSNWPPLPSTVVGDRYAGANIQYYATYSESISACQYKSPDGRRLCVNGFLPTQGQDEPVGTNYDSSVITQLSQEQSVRLTNTASGAGNPAYAAMGHDMQSTSGQPQIQVTNSVHDPVNTVNLNAVADPSTFDPTVNRVQVET